jgi:hypothetical protein
MYMVEVIDKEGNTEREEWWMGECLRTRGRRRI